MGATDIAYYAVFAVKTGTESKTDNLTISTTGVTTTNYTDFSYKSASNSGHSDAVYAGECLKNSSSIQLNDGSPKGIVTTISEGKAKKVTVTWNSGTTGGRTLDIYGKNTAYTDGSDLYNSSKGTKLGSIVKGTSTELTITGDYKFIGLRSYSGAMSLDEISIDWETPTYLTYSTSVIVTTPAVSAAGWATYVTPYDVQFTEGEAFAVTSVGTNVVLTSVTDVPENEPLLLKGAGIKMATVLIESPAAITNLLAVSDGDDGVNDYVLANHNSKVGFYKWTGSALASGKVYLPASEITNNAREFFGFNDEINGIVNINSETKTLYNSDFFNVAGQRIVQPAKGLYIVNGKKVIIK